MQSNYLAHCSLRLGSWCFEKSLSYWSRLRSCLIIVSLPELPLPYHHHHCHRLSPLPLLSPHTPPKSSSSSSLLPHYHFHHHHHCHRHHHLYHPTYLYFNPTRFSDLYLLCFKHPWANNLDIYLFRNYGSVMASSPRPHHTIDASHVVFIELVKKLQVYTQGPHLRLITWPKLIKWFTSQQDHNVNDYYTEPSSSYLNEENSNWIPPPARSSAIYLNMRSSCRAHIVLCLVHSHQTGRRDEYTGFRIFVP